MLGGKADTFNKQNLSRDCSLSRDSGLDQAVGSPGSRGESTFSDQRRIRCGYSEKASLNRLKFFEPDLERQEKFDKVEEWERHLRTY